MSCLWFMFQNVAPSSVAFPQCSPQIFAQQVRDHSQPVRQKICTTEVYVSGDRRVVECGKWPRSCWEIQELSSLKSHSLNIRPALCKLAVVTFSQQIKTTDSNSVLNVLFPKCVAHKKKSCVRSKSERSVLALKVGPFRCGKIQSQYSPVSQG